MAFPRLNAFTYWTYLLSGIFLYVAPALGQAPHAGWFSYVPYTNIRYSPGLGMDFYAVSLIFLTISTTGGAANFVELGSVSDSDPTKFATGAGGRWRSWVRSRSCWQEESRASNRPIIHSRAMAQARKDTRSDTAPRTQTML